MRGNFKLALLRVRPLNGADLPIVGRVSVGCRERKWLLSDWRPECLPVDRVAELNAIARIACRKADSLNKL